LFEVEEKRKIEASSSRHGLREMLWASQRELQVSLSPNGIFQLQFVMMREPVTDLLIPVKNLKLRRKPP
jgi:hypothetical protein